MTMSLFHNLKLKRRKVDSRSSSDGSEAAAAEIVSPQASSLASGSSEISMEDRNEHRPSSRGTAFEVEVKKFDMTAPRYTNWASPAKLKQEPFFTTVETTTLTPATVVPKIFSNGSENTPSSHLPKGLTLGPDHRPRLTEALRSPNGPPGGPMVTMSSAAHLPFAAAAAAAKLQAMQQHHSNLVTSSAHPQIGQVASPLPSSPVHLQAPHQGGHPHGLQHPLRMTGPPHPLPALQTSTAAVKLSSSPIVKTEQNSRNGTNGSSNNQNQRKQGPSVILGEHGGVKTMIWTDSTTYWQSANKYRNNLQAPSQPPSSQVPPAPMQMHPLSSAPYNDKSSPASSPILKMGRPPDNREQALKMSSAVDGLLSLSSQGQRPSPSPASSTPPPPMASTSPCPPSSLPHQAPHLLHLSPAHMPHSSSPSLVVPTPPISMPQSVIPSSTAPSSQQPPPPPRRRSPMNMERLWAGDMSQLPSHVIESQNGHMNIGGLRPNPDHEDEEPLLCNICEDRATGLHYGIITCEG